MVELTEPFKNRLEMALAIRGVRPVELSEKTGILQSTISQYRSGYAEPKSDKLVAIANALSVNPVWLMGVDVPMEMPETTLQKYEEEGRAFAQKREITDAIDKLMKLSTDDQNMVVSMIDQFYDRIKK